MRIIKIKVPDGKQEFIKEIKDGYVIKFIEVDKEKNIKEFLAPFLTNLTMFHNEKYPNTVFYKQNDVCLFQLNKINGRDDIDLYVGIPIWSVLRSKFGLNFDEARTILKAETENAFKLNKINIYFSNSQFALGFNLI